MQSIDPSTRRIESTTFILLDKEGFLAREWIEGYSVDENRVFEVLTLWRSMYAE